MFRVLTILLLVFVTAPHANSMQVARSAQQTAVALQATGLHADENSQMGMEMQCCCCEQGDNAAGAAAGCFAAMVLAPDSVSSEPAVRAARLNVPLQTSLLAARQSSIDRPPIQRAA
ncbi:hypothetical protein PsAD2_02667 [Pseudovibrio axinellae]|uniref:DUF2946 domain-containing protein n=1 Tax=Pseudovibrio axinellae TaxID=989403 RepID=A0A165XZQ5_9HYPH|nr:hypothetical protein [Pseudovibrio axinellae]KZL18275.1 hypothetical protein PsAD2_02667 [Pseudovibrio axinellae]SER72802.1 hypothetical protein SAMN05421798_11842 [Pseudovibrio axinellae]